MNVIKLYDKLYDIYGPQDWWPIYVFDPDLQKYRLQHDLTYGIPWKKLGDFFNTFRDPYFEIAIGAILAQNVSWKNVAVAIQNLYISKALRPERIVKMKTKRLEDLLVPTRYYAQKAKKLKLFSKWLIDEHGGDILKLKSYELRVMRSELLSQWGIGKETADSILLYALCEPIFTVDVYTKRLCEKFNVHFDEYDEYRTYFENGLKKSAKTDAARAKLYQEYHALIVASGQDKHAQL